MGKREDSERQLKLGARHSCRFNKLTEKDDVTGLAISRIRLLKRHERAPPEEANQNPPDIWPEADASD